MFRTVIPEEQIVLNPPVANSQSAPEPMQANEPITINQINVNKKSSSATNVLLTLRS